MNDYILENINGVKKIIEHFILELHQNRKDFKYNTNDENNRELAQSYLFTNENIKYYFNLLNFNNIENALTVLSSGDHLFNLVANGITQIDTFDINRLTEYYALGIKRAIILKYSYEEFLSIYKNIIHGKMNGNYIYGFIMGLYPYLELEHRLFWDAIIDYCYKVQKETNINLNIFNILYYYINELMPYVKNNYYLENSEIYEYVRNRIGSCNISFIQANAINIGKNFNKKYDLILLSNIMDYFCYDFGNDWSYQDLENYEKSLEDIANRNCFILLHYIFDLIVGRSEYIDPLIQNTTINEIFLKDEEIFIVPKSKKHFFSLNDGIILKRIK